MTSAVVAKPKVCQCLLLTSILVTLGHQIDVNFDLQVDLLDVGDKRLAEALRPWVER